MSLQTHKKIQGKFSALQLLSLLFLLGLPFVFVSISQAANLEVAYVRLDRLAASIATGGTVCAQAETVGTEVDVQVVFPTGFTVNSTPGNWTVTTTNLPSGATAWPVIGTATAVSSQTVTFPSTDLTISTLYCFNFTGTSTLTTSTAGNDKFGSIVLIATGPATID